MQKITPHLWFDKEAKEAAAFYVSIFPNSRITYTTQLYDTPSGTTDVVTFELSGLEFQAISAGPFFKFNPSVSFQVLCNTKEDVDALYEKLVEAGSVLMELGEYPFSERYAWVQDRFGLSWQLMQSRESGGTMRIQPMMLFVGEVCGKAEEAINFWISVFNNGKVNQIQRYGKDEQPDQEGSVKYATFTLFDQGFAAMDSAYEHAFQFGEAISFIVNCESQTEIDEYWRKLSAVPESEQCGWLKDKFGLSWQIVPVQMGEMLQSGDRAKIDRVTQAFLPMKKLDIATLKAAYDGK
jgi:predicted 3-demethylubiquinone-9 3-methyltransferase (glyoxalase superfamily)